MKFVVFETRFIVFVFLTMIKRTPADSISFFTLGWSIPRRNWRYLFVIKDKWSYLIGFWNLVLSTQKHRWSASIYQFHYACTIWGSVSITHETHRSIAPIKSMSAYGVIGNTFGNGLQIIFCFPNEFCRRPRTLPLYSFFINWSAIEKELVNTLQLLSRA